MLTGLVIRGGKGVTPETQGQGPQKRVVSSA